MGVSCYICGKSTAHFTLIPYSKGRRMEVDYILCKKHLYSILTIIENARKIMFGEEDGKESN